MSLADLASLGSLISGVGVLISVLLLFFQMRQVSTQIQLAERNQKAAIQQDRYGRVFEVHLARTEPSAAAAIAKGMAGARDMSATQISQFQGYSRARFQISENTFLQHEAGLLSDAAFAAFSNNVVDGLSSPGIRVMWKWAKISHAAEFVAFVDRLMPQASQAAPVDPLARWKADLDAEEAG
jgi:hypothetical protein